MGLYDIPATVDFILEATNRSKLDAYIAHSEGTTQFFIGQTLKPDYYAKNIELFVALAPVVRLEHTTNAPTKTFAKAWPVLVNFVKMTGMYNLAYQSQPVAEALSAACRADISFCMFTVEGTWNSSKYIQDAVRMPDVKAHIPDGAGYRNTVHFA